MFGIDDVVATSYRITRDTIGVLGQCLAPWNIREYCLKCDVPPFFPSEGFSETLTELEKELDEPGVDTAENLTKLLTVVETVIEILETTSGALDLGKQVAAKLLVPALIFTLREKRDYQWVYVAALILVLLDRRLQEAYPHTSGTERIAEFFRDALRDGVRRPATGADPADTDEELQPDVLAALIGSALPLGAFLLAKADPAPESLQPFFDYGFDHPPIPGLEETNDSAQHAFAAFLGVDDVSLQQGDYAAFDAQGPPFRKRPVALSFVPVVRSPETVPENEQHGGGVWFQLNGRHGWSVGSGNTRLVVTVQGGGGVLIAFEDPLDEALVGSLSAIVDFTVDDPSAASFSDTEIPKGVGVRARRLAAHVEAGVAGGVGAPEEFDVSGFVRVEQGELVVGKLPLIGLLMPSGFRIAFDAGLVGSLRRRELHFEGGLATELVVPLNWKVPLLPITAHSVTVRLNAQIAQGAASGQPTSEEASRRSALSVQVTANLSLSLFSILTAQVDGLGFAAVLRSAPDLDGTVAGVVDTDWEVVMPNGVGLTVDVRGITGGGFASYDKASDRLFAGLALDFGGQFALKAIGLCEPAPNRRGHSWIIVASLELPRSGGAITVEGMGLLYGSNRRSDPDAFLAGLGAGNLDALVLPGDPTPKFATYSAVLGALFPRSDDGEVLGVIFKIGLLGGKVKIALGLIVDTGGALEAQKLYVIITVVATFPNARLPVLRIEAAGVAIWDASRNEFNLRIVLRNSKLFGGELTGEAVAFYGDPDREDENETGTWLASFGGFHPRFQVPGPQIHVPKPLQLSFARGDHIKIEWRLYFALTPGAVHFGVSVELQARFSGFGIRGRLAIDILISYLALRFVAELTFSIELQLGSRTLAGLAFKGTLKGFFPAELSGKVSVKFLFWTWTSPRIAISLTAEEDEDETTDLVPELVSAVSDVRNWDNGGAAGLTLRPADRAGVWLSPSAPLTFRQAVAPLDRTITRCGSAALPAPTVFTIEPIRAAGTRWAPRPVNGEFAPGLYVELSQEESLSATSFVALPAGFAIERPFDTGTALELTLDYEQVVLDSANPEPTVERGKTFNAAVFAAMAECAPSLHERSRWSPARPVAMHADTFAVVSPALSPAATAVDYLQAVSLVRQSGNTQFILAAVEAA